MLDVVEAQGFRKVACATTAPMHFQLLESDVLLGLPELLLVELCRAALTLSSNSCLRQFAPDFPTLQASLVMYQFPFKSGGFSCSWWSVALERWGLLARRLRLGAGLLNPGGAPPSNEEVKSYQRCCHAPFVFKKTV